MVRISTSSPAYIAMLIIVVLNIISIIISEHFKNIGATCRRPDMALVDDGGALPRQISRASGVQPIVPPNWLGQSVRDALRIRMARIDEEVPLEPRRD